MTEIDILLKDLSTPGVLLELAVLAACVAAAYGFCWLVRRHQAAAQGEARGWLGNHMRHVGRIGAGDAQNGSVLFGRGIVDGVLFPVTALILAWAARSVVDDYQHVAVLKVAVPLLMSLAVIRFLARVLAAVFPNSGTARLAERLFSWLAWAAAALWIVGLLPSVLAEMESVGLTIGKTRLSLLGIVEGTLTAALMIVAVLWISATIERRVLRDTVNDLSLRRIAANSIRAVLLLVGVLFTLSTVGVDLTALSVLGGALGVGLGFGLQKLASNYVSGFVILFERSLRIGDNVRLDSFEGVITDIKTRYTLVRAGTGRESIVPNEMLITQRVENLSAEDRRAKLTGTVAVGYTSDVDEVLGILKNSASANPAVLKDPAPVAFLMEFGAQGLEFSYEFNIDATKNGKLTVRSEVNAAIYRSLRAAGIEVRPPQRVLQVQEAGTASPSGTAATS
ncbi:MAG: mechanosensitive ion channel domain-containing protein [Burkholderiaceae bacterium]